MSTEPTLAEIIRVAAENRERDLFTALVGVVQAYTPGPPGPPVVDVLPVIKRALPDRSGGIVHEDLPVIPNVPVIFPSVGNFSFSWPIAPGDHVLLVCTGWSHQAWRETGAVSEPGDLRTHEVGNAVAFAGVHPKTTTIPTAADAALLEVDGITVTHVQVGAGAADFVTLDGLIQARLGELFDAITNAVPKPGGLDGGAQFKTQLLAALGLAGWSSAGTTPTTAATKLKSE